ncbi:MAG: Anti-sigma regulatory factor [Methanophagales archaeon]|nr:Anti-sigma regulatory factor [Methanophagales archaeon]
MVKIMVKIEIKEEYDIVTARVSAKEEAKKLGFGIVDQTRIATAVSELARNIVDYAGEGVIEINIVRTEGC